MAQLREIKNRIDSIEGTQKITNAMYMISTTKLRQAKISRDNNAVYFNALKNMLERLLRHLPSFDHPYLRVSDKPKEEQVHAYIVVTADRGLAGAYNLNVIKAADKLAGEDGGRAQLFVVGEAGRRYYHNHGVKYEEGFVYSSERPTHARSRAITEIVLSKFEDGLIDDLKIIYTDMKSAIENDVRVRQMLPLVSAFDKMKNVPGDIYNEEFLLSPSPQEVLNAVVPNYLNGYIYSALIESFCAEQNSRMLAMQTASDAAVSIVKDLSVKYNRARQQVITQELTEVSAGAEAIGAFMD